MLQGIGASLEQRSISQWDMYSPALTLNCIYPKNSDTSTSYHTCSKILTSTIYYPMLCLKTAEWANSVDPDEMPILQHLIWVYTVYSG